MNISQLIHDALDSQELEHRAYIGASSIGNQCERAIWYGLHKPESKEIDAKTRLTFEIGHALESLLLNLFRREVVIERPLPYKCSEYPLFQGSADAVILDDHLSPIALFEIKTAKDSSFNIFKKKGLRLWYPEYYDQVQSYMGMSDIHDCYLIAINKDSSELHEEHVSFDAKRYKELVQKAMRIGSAVIEPPRVNGSPSYFKCKLCFYKNICHIQG